MTIQAGFERILADYSRARTSEPFGKAHPLWGVMEDVATKFSASAPVAERSRLQVAWTVGKGNWATVPWISFLDERETASTQEGVYAVYLFRADMSAVYITFNQGVTGLKRQHGAREARRILRERAGELRQFCTNLPERGFGLDEGIDLRAGRGLGADYEHSTVAYKSYDRGAVPPDAELLADLEAVLRAYDGFLGSNMPLDGPKKKPAPEEEIPATFDIEQALDRLLAFIEAEGFVFEPWQVAEYVTAIRTKPFAILAGVSGTGKSKLPALVARGTGSESRLIPVRPDWTDSADVLGYVDLQGEFRPGRVLEVLHQATEESDSLWVVIVDEMNLARVEQYFAEILSHIEDRRSADGGGFESGPLVTQAVRKEDAEWGEVTIPPNVILVGTVNMDETTHGFSRKVLDRAFTIELSDVRLSTWNVADEDEERGETPLVWPLSVWQPDAISLSGIQALNGDRRHRVEAAIDTLEQVNAILKQAQLQVGYRTRDEVALFLLHAAEIESAFVTSAGDPVDPLDLVLHMKILPRIVGGSMAVRRSLVQLLGWADSGEAAESEADARAIHDRWEREGRPGALAEARFPRTAGRLCLMWERLESEGYTSFWL